MDELESLYIPYHNHKQALVPICKGLIYLGHFVGFGRIMAQHKLWSWNKMQTPQNARGKGLIRSEAFQEKCLDAALRDLKDCVVISTTPSYYTQFHNACLLKERGFQLLENSCYKHPGYSGVSTWPTEHPGIPDKYWHWEHIWYKVLGSPKALGWPRSKSLNNCGVDFVAGLDQIQLHDSGKVETANTLGPTDRKAYLAVGLLPRGTAFPKGWKRFFSAEDYKLGVNFETGLAAVQKCPHNFDPKIFDKFEPDFTKWSPA